jgi:hypothetical protein
MFYIKTNEKKIHIKSYGYKTYSSEISNNIYEIIPIKVKALYLTFWGASLKAKTFAKILKIIKEKEINSIVVDVKTVYGNTSYKTSIPAVNKFGVWKKRTIKDISKFLQIMKNNNIYTIARIAVFKDDIQASNNPIYAVKNSKNKLWKNHDKMAWVDPFDKRAHEYTISIAEDAAKVGFNEINYDYIRFPAKKNLIYSKKSNRKNRVKAISSFLKKSRERLLKYGVYTSVNTYGNIFRNTNSDSNIGQEIVSLSKYVDYIYPMLYPSGFAQGSFGKKYPSRHPYTVIFNSINDVKHIIDPIRIRPWIQYFKDYSSGRQHYGKRELDLQIKGSDDSNASGWLVWNSASRYNINDFNN